MTTKRIKIEDPRDLREGMRVEVMYSDDEPLIGRVWKGENPYSNELYYSIPNGSNEVSFNLVTVHGEYKRDIECVYRLIDGIEDVVVGDELVDFDGQKMICDAKINNVCFAHGDNCLDSYWRIDQLKNNGWKIYIPEEQKTELTETEAKEIIAEVKGEEIENITIKRDE
jgi:hypothetical protein